ncbi:ARM repeat-containing protein [Metschnikowia bicuspidata var. bicuspidata NRRL YB-4993]|uniref:ARM repeat-containing protein n=1 Tax=Metschnikowia bicuspidata var. bicuspidata NRRL YB-4993 TaxID=869754 RepID=A0A1A0HHG0_9ASCO|nr:ARM repeat-containing protein [Metschnikowia bicuspidata var. bicuspidata NRRL YB-4993]OBA23440.1 ARM repeat-containing protein [Metschnikowia bicuspidata var. bicuspidata NRRL YB-4993]
MDKESLLKSLAGTLDANYQIRKQSEEQLRYFEEMPGFTAYLLSLITDTSINLGVQTSAAIFFKNRINNYWIVPELKTATSRHIQDAEKATIKAELIEVLSQTYKNTQLRVQLSTAISHILNAEKWDELVSVTSRLLNNTTNIDHVFTGLICLFEYTKNYRYAGLDSPNFRNIILDEVTETMFPTLETLTCSLLNEDSVTADEMLYLIMKIFKFATYSNFPPYLEEQSNLGKWCQYHLMLITKPLPATVVRADAESRVSCPRVKAVKWCFGNMHRLISRHGGGINTKDKKTAFVSYFLSHFVPEILNAYWAIIEKWTTKELWLSEASLYHLIAFLEQVIETPAYGLLEDKLEAVVAHVLMPMLNASQETIQLYEDEPEEYIRRFYDVSRENTTADTAAVNFLFRLSSTKFSSCGTLLLTLINNIFQKRASERENLEIAMQTEGALRVLATISYRLDKKSSPVQGQLDQLIHSVIYPELSQETIDKMPWLTARACDTIAIFVHKFSDQAVLQDIFHGVVACFQHQEQFPIQLTAIDALRTLVEEEYVAERIAQQAPQLMGTLLDLSKNFESDTLTSVMDVFVSKFAANLEPYANELSYRLVEQFLKLAQEILEQMSNAQEILEQMSNGGNSDIDKEYQAAGILNTLTSLVVSMSSSPEVSANLELVIKDVVKLILENSMLMFLTEGLEMAESILYSTNTMSPSMWEIYQDCIDAFDTYAFEYFDTFQPFFESVVRSSFVSEEVTIENPHVQSLFKVCFQVLQGDVDPVFAHYAFELMEFTEVFTVFTTLESEDAFDGHMLHHLSILKIFFACLFVEPAYTLQFLNEKQFTSTFFKLWIKYGDEFQSVYGCKLQILAALSIVIDAPMNVLPGEDLVGETADLVISNLEHLPHAIRAKQELIDRESGVKVSAKDYQNEEDGDDDDFYEDDLEADEAELEALKATPIDLINVYQVFAEKATAVQQADPSRHQLIFGNLDDSQKEVALRIIQINQQQKNAAGQGI